MVVVFRRRMATLHHIFRVFFEHIPRKSVTLFTKMPDLGENVDLPLASNNKQQHIRNRELDNTLLIVKVPLEILQTPNSIHDASRTECLLCALIDNFLPTLNTNLMYCYQK
jgi:hypothetical protein